MSSLLHQSYLPPAGEGNGCDAFPLSTISRRNPFLPSLSSALEMEIRESNEAWLSKSARLSGLEDQVGKIRDAINKQVAYYESCS